LSLYTHSLHDALPISFEFPEAIELSTTLQDIIDYASEKDEKYYYREGKQPFYDKLEEEVDSYESVYQWRRQYVRENKSGESTSRSEEHTSELQSRFDL